MNLKNALTLAFGVALLGTTTAIRASDAVLVQKSGTVTVTLPNGSQKELNQGDMIPEGSTVTTSADGTAYVEPVVGAVATLQGSTTVKVEKIKVSQDSSGTVTKQEVLLDLTAGNLVSTLDPAKRGATCGWMTPTVVSPSTPISKLTIQVLRVAICPMAADK